MRIPMMITEKFRYSHVDEDKRRLVYRSGNVSGESTGSEGSEMIDRHSAPGHRSLWPPVSGNVTGIAALVLVYDSSVMASVFGTRPAQTYGCNLLKASLERPMNFASHVDHCIDALLRWQKSVEVGNNTARRRCLQRPAGSVDLPVPKQFQDQKRTSESPDGQRQSMELKNTARPDDCPSPGVKDQAEND